MAPKRPGENTHPETSWEIKITGKYIIFPVANEGQQRGRTRITVDGQLVHHLDCDFPPNKDAIDWWTYLDMSEYIGKTARVRGIEVHGDKVERAEAGQRMPVGDYLQEVIREWQSRRPEASLDYHTGAQTPGTHILSERTLTQSLINILNNAADASPDDVWLRSGWSGTELLLEIGDRGTGIDTAIQGQLGKTPVSTKNGGLGVGLYLAHATLQRLGGTVTVHNRDGGGTLTRITLPLLTG